MEQAPRRVQEFADALVRTVSEAISVELDFTPYTLPFLDHYLDHYRRTIGVDAMEKPEILQLVAPMVGCYFAEVVRRSHGARWVMPDENVRTWRMELTGCFLFFNPMGLAVESFLEREVEDIPGAFQVSSQKREAVEEMLDSQPDIDERDFYRMTVRWEILDLIASHLMQDRLLRGEDLGVVTEEQYRLQIEEEEVDR